MKSCFRVGLYKQGLLHDLSKYSPREFMTGAKYWSGTESPNNAERRERGLSPAWLHHKGRNKHHMEYWIDYCLTEENKAITGMKMPTRYVVEMFLDRVAACKNYQKEKYTDESALLYYEKGKGRMIIHPDSARLLEGLLKMLAKRGEEETFKYIRSRILSKRNKRKKNG